MTIYEEMERKQRKLEGNQRDFLRDFDHVVAEVKKSSSSNESAVPSSSSSRRTSITKAVGRQSKPIEFTYIQPENPRTSSGGKKYSDQEPYSISRSHLYTTSSVSEFVDTNNTASRQIFQINSNGMGGNSIQETQEDVRDFMISRNHEVDPLFSSLTDYRDDSVEGQDYMSKVVLL